MNVDNTDIEAMIAAMFSYEFLDSALGYGKGIDYDSLERIHRGDVGEWVDALEWSGLFDLPTLDALRDSWHRHPKGLLDLLLVEADEVTVRRCSTTWAALDRVAPLGSLGRIV